jgi:pentatricopeptide repeat protein
MKDAYRVLHKTCSHDVVSWIAMLVGFAMHGHAKEAIARFEQMCEEGVEP